MQFFIDPKGTTVNLISDPVYEGSTNANELVLVAPISSENQVTATFMLPIGISTTERLLTLQSSMSIDDVQYNVWRCLLDGTVTEYAGTVRVQFKIYQGNTIILNTYASSFVVSEGITPQLPDTPTQNIYESILQYLSGSDSNFNMQSIVYNAPDEYKISTGTSTNSVEKIPSDLVLKDSVTFDADNIGDNGQFAFFACGENKSNTDVGFQINFNTKTDIGWMSIYLFREYYSTALKVYAITSDGQEKLVGDFVTCAPGDDVICVSVHVWSYYLTGIRVIQSFAENAEIDNKNDIITDKGFQNGRFYVQKILFWKPNYEGYFSFVSSNGRTITISDVTSKAKWAEQAATLATNASLTARKSASSAENSASTATSAAANAQENAEYAQNSADDAATSASMAASAAANAVSEVNNKLKIGVVKSVTVEKIEGDIVVKTVTRNIESGVETQESQNIEKATENNAGLMSKEAYLQLQENTESIQQLKGNMIRLLYTTSSAPTSADIETFVISKGYTPSPTVAVVVQNTTHIWRYYTGTGYKDDGIDTVSQFTNSVAGVLKGSLEDGKVNANSDGTGGVNGWDVVKTDISALKLNKLSNSDVVNTTGNDTTKPISQNAATTAINTVQSNLESATTITILGANDT